ncbi:MAG: GNAT family N-acetyltransferase [Paracoccaceae bacterium]|nr:GNAT family N-acetyltransferase [Paracoccaceae bacterium]
MGVSIATASLGDEAEWRGLWAAYLEFYQVELSSQVTDRTWARILDPASPLVARLARVDGVMRGFALHHHHASTWVAGDDCYLEDLFVSDSARGHGLGRALIDDLIGIARAQGFHRLYWHTDEDNTRARALYDSYMPYDGHVRYRIPL